jgi:predicted Zn-dependent peptidase
VFASRFVQLGQLRTVAGGRDQLTVYRDPVSGLRHLHLSTGDPNTAVGIALQTLTDTAPGLPHALEHMIGCGSGRYPVPRLFGTLSSRLSVTFANAFTGLDFTCFAASSTCQHSLRVLTEILVDGVFAPLLTAPAFAEEVFRLENGKERGVVWQEAVSRWSDPAAIGIRAATAAVFTDDALRLLQGQGENPDDIRAMALDDVRSYHARTYRPSQAWLMSAGDAPASIIQRSAQNVLPDSAGPEQELGDARECDPAGLIAPRQTGVTKLAADGSWGTDPGVVVAVPLGSIAQPGAVARTQVLGDVLLSDPSSPVLPALSPHAAHGLMPGSGAHVHLPLAILVIGTRCHDRSTSWAIGAAIDRALTTELDYDAIRGAVMQRLTLARDRSNRSFPGHPWTVQTILNWANPLVHGADPLAVGDHPCHLAAIAERPAALGEWLKAAADQHGARLAVIGDASARTQQASGAAPRASRALRLQGDAGRGVTASRDGQVGPLSADASAHAMLTADEIAPRQPRYQLSRAAAGRPLWTCHASTNGLYYLLADLDCSAVPAELFPHLTSYAMALARAKPWQISHGLLTCSAPSDLERATVWLRLRARCPAADADRLAIWFGNLLAFPARQPDEWLPLVRAVRTSLCKAGHEAGWLTAAVGAQLTAAAHAANAGIGLVALQRLAAMSAADFDAEAADVSTAVATAPITMVATADIGAIAPDLVAIVASARPDRCAAYRHGILDGNSAQPFARAAVAAPEPGSSRNHLIALPTRGGQQRTLAAYRGTAPATALAAALCVAAAVLRGRLYMRLRSGASAHGIAASYDLQAGLLRLACTHDTATPAEILAAFRAEIESLAATQPSVAEVEAAKLGALNALVPLGSVDTTAADRVLEDATGLTSARNYVATEIKLITPAATSAVAEQYLVHGVDAAGAVAAERDLAELADQVVGLGGSVIWLRHPTEHRELIHDR